MMNIKQTPSVLNRMETSHYFYVPVMSSACQTRRIGYGSIIAENEFALTAN